eukprot:gene2045-2517_t
MLTLPPLVNYLALGVGLLLISNYALRFLLFVYAYFLRPSVNLKKYGSWAVVTGSTDGIGKAYCHELAKKGINICLISRNMDKLKAEASDIESKYKVKTKVIAFDFNTSDDSKYDTLYNQFSDLEVGILVNNVGVSYEHPMFLEELQRNSIDSLINCNVRAATVLSKLVIPSMVQRKKGAIINLSSISALTPIPFLSVYSGTKAFVERFTISLNLEYGSKGIFVQNITPGIVVSNMSKIRRPSLFQPLPNVFVKSAVATIGHDRNTAGYWAHEIQAFVLRNFPSFIIDKQMADLHLGQRKRALAKKKSQ